jgi:hypothetical protein
MIERFKWWGEIAGCVAGYHVVEFSNSGSGRRSSGSLSTPQRKRVRPSVAANIRQPGHDPFIFPAQHEQGRSSGYAGAAHNTIGVQVETADSSRTSMNGAVPGVDLLFLG